MKPLTFALCFLLLALPLGACGKKGPPIPNDTTNLFSWKAAKGEVFTEKYDGQLVRCLSVTADLAGAAHNAERFILEIEPQTADVCEGCPFLPAEFADVVPETAIAAQDFTRYTFAYCPAKQADAYRWRLAAHSVFKGVPHAFSKVYGPVR